MLYNLESLNPDVARRIAKWDRQLFTATEMTGWLLDRFAFAVHDFPDALPVVAEALDSVPAPLLAAMAERLAECRTPGGGWHWPPVRGLPDPDPPRPWGIAGPQEAASLNRLADWLQQRIVG